MKPQNIKLNSGIIGYIIINILKDDILSNWMKKEKMFLINSHKMVKFIDA